MDFPGCGSRRGSSRHNGRRTRLRPPVLQEVSSAPRCPAWARFLASPARQGLRGGPIRSAVLPRERRRRAALSACAPRLAEGARACMPDLSQVSHRTRAEFVRLGRRSAMFGPNSSLLCPGSAKLWPRSAKFGPNSTKRGPTSTQLGKKAPGIGQVWAESRPQLARMGGIWADVGRSAPSWGQVLRKPAKFGLDTVGFWPAQAEPGWGPCARVVMGRLWLTPNIS